jgi:uridine phosphorylase
MVIVEIIFNKKTHVFFILPYFNIFTRMSAELILTKDHKVYHLQLSADQIADNVFLVGDQDRVAQISAYFSNIDCRVQHREFITHTGTYHGKRISVVSTGIGTDNIDIVLNELDAAVNLNLKTGEALPQKKSLNLIRLGTSGALQADIPVNAIVASTHAIGLDGLLPFYQDWEKVQLAEISAEFIKHCRWPNTLPFPYAVKANPELLERLAGDCYHGITATAPGFYGPQGRQIRLHSSMPSLNDLLTSFRYHEQRITNFEMETSALYGLGALLGHRCLTMCVIIANRANNTFTDNYQQSITKLIEHSLNKIAS